MFRRKEKKAVRAVFVYMLLTVGSWMFINSYANSYNRFTQEKIAPASLVMTGSTANVEILEYSAQFSISGLSPESRVYCIAYLLAPDELRASAYLISALP